MLKKVVALNIMVLMVLALRLFSAQYKADVFMEKSIDLLSTDQLADAFYYADLSVQYNPYEPNYYRNRARVYLTFLITEKDSVSAKELRNVVKNDLDYAYMLNPHNLVTVRNSIPLLFYLAHVDLSKPVFSDNADPVLRTYAKSYFDQVSQMAPNDVGFYALLAKYQNRLGLQTDYEQSVQKIKDLRPDILDWYLTD